MRISIFIRSIVMTLQHSFYFGNDCINEVHMNEHLLFLQPTQGANTTHGLPEEHKQILGYKQGMSCHGNDGFLFNLWSYICGSMWC